MNSLEGLVSRLGKLEKRVVELERENSILRERLLAYEKPKNSRNSSIPPSTDQNRPKKNQSLRQRSDKKIGGQPGHKGSTLEMTGAPDEIIDHYPDYCSSCGASLSAIASGGTIKRQVVDIPPVIPKYTEHRAYDKTCSRSHKNKGAFPSNVTAPISYGTNVMATIGYLHTRQYLPFARMSEFFGTVCNLHISQGTLCNIVSAFAAKAAPAYQLIKERVATEKVVGTDETGIRINGTTHWFWTWQSRLSTFIVFSLNRGGATIRLNFPLGFQKAVLVSDCWSSHFKTPCNTHQLCLAHLLRELIFLEESFNSKWATDFKSLLYQGITLKKQLDQNQYDYPVPDRDEILEKLKKLLEKPPKQDHKKLQAFYRRMVKYQNYIFTFLHYHNVPPDNNASERAIRNVKVKQKVSGQFKTEKGAQIYAVIRSVTDTCIKNGTNILDAFKTIATLQPE